MRKLLISLAAVPFVAVLLVVAAVGDTQCGPGGITTAQVPAETMGRINALRGVYVRAAATQGAFPWELLAAVDYREVDNDPHKLTTINEDSGRWVTEAEKEARLVEVAAVLNRLAQRSPLAWLRASVDGPGRADTIKDALFSYNGRAGVYAQQASSLGFDPNRQPFEGSPYVMNRYDAARQSMGIITHDHGGMDGHDTRLGAYTLMVELVRAGGGQLGDGSPGGSSGGTPGCGGGGPPGSHGAAAVQAAMVYLGRPYVWGATGPDAFDCSGLMWRAYHDIGVEIGRDTGEQLSDGASAGKDLSGAGPGDLVIVSSRSSASGRHVGMYVGVDEQGRHLWVVAPQARGRREGRAGRQPRHHRHSEDPLTRPRLVAVGLVAAVAALAGGAATWVLSPGGPGQAPRAGTAATAPSTTVPGTRAAMPPGTLGEAAPTSRPRDTGDDMPPGTPGEPQSLVEVLPVENTHFRIAPAPTSTGRVEYVITLYAILNRPSQYDSYVAQLRQYRDEALTWVTAHGFDPHALDLRLEPGDQVPLYDAEQGSS